MLRKIILVAGGFAIISAATLFGLFFLAFNPEARIVVLGGDHTAEARLETGVRVTIEMAAILHLAEYEWRLTVCRNWCAQLWLITDFGGLRQVNLYRRSDGKIVVVDAFWMIEVDEFAPSIRIYDYEDEKKTRLRHALRWDCRSELFGPLASEDGPPDSIYFKDMKYLGMFEFFDKEDRIVSTVRRGDFRYVTSSQHGEYLCGYPHRG